MEAPLQVAFHTVYPEALLRPCIQRGPDYIQLTGSSRKGHEIPASNDLPATLLSEETSVRTLESLEDSHLFSDKGGNACYNQRTAFHNILQHDPSVCSYVLEQEICISQSELTVTTSGTHVQVSLLCQVWCNSYGLRMFCVISFCFGLFVSDIQIIMGSSRSLVFECRDWSWPVAGWGLPVCI